MITEDWLICGTRNKFNQEFVSQKLSKLMWNNRALYKGWKPNSIIEGCCPESADVWAENWAKQEEITIQHYPSTSGNYLKRNIEMCLKASLVIAFWDGFSYGTAHTISQATLRKIPVIIYHTNEVKSNSSHQ